VQIKGVGKGDGLGGLKFSPLKFLIYNDMTSKEKNYSKLPDALLSLIPRLLPM